MNLSGKEAPPWDGLLDRNAAFWGEGWEENNKHEVWEACSLPNVLQEAFFSGWFTVRKFAFAMNATAASWREFMTSFLWCEFGALVVVFLFFPVLFQPNQTWLNLVSLVFRCVQHWVLWEGQKVLGFLYSKGSDNFIQLKELLLTSLSGLCFSNSSLNLKMLEGC